MADNITLNAGAGGAVVATDDDGVAHHQYVKLEFGPDNTQTKVTASVGLPTDPLDRAARDMGKIDVASLDQYTAIDVDSGAGSENALPVSVRIAASGGSIAPSYGSGATDAGTQRVTVATDSTGVLSVDDNGATLSIDDGAGAITVDNGGTFAVQVDGSALTALQKIDDPVLVDDAAFTPATSSVMMAGFEADETATDSVDEGDAGAARMTLDRKVIVTPQPHTAGGLSIFRSLDLDETEEDVKTSAGCVYGAWVTNTATATRWLKFYNDTAANVIVGTTTPVITIGIPGNTSDDISANFGPGGMGIAFSAAICVAATTGVADNDTGAPAANDVIVNIFYK